jgi:PKD repeat protein
MKRTLIIFTLLILVKLISAQVDNLRVMYYNILDYPFSGDPGREINFRKVNRYLQADVILVTELKSSTGATTLLNEALNVFGTTHYQKAIYYTGDYSENLLYYNSDKLVLQSQDVIYTSLRDINEYVLYYKSSDLGTTSDTIFFYFYVAHLKASEGYEQDRLAEVNQFLNHLNAISNAENVFFGGDFNLYTSSEPAYQALIDNTPYLLNDPLPAGNWHASATYSDIHTQSTRTTDFGGGSTGGMDDRFDFILFTGDVNSGANKVQYVNNSCMAFGNDGNHFNDALIDLPINPDLPDSIIQALYYMSDHLPVICDLTVQATVDTTHSDLVITEIYYNPPETLTDTLEFIEIYNNGSNPVNLAGYTLSSAVTFTFPSVGINPGDYTVVAFKPSAMLFTFGVSAFQWTGGLNNDGELILLKNSSGFTIDSVFYNDVNPWPTSADGTGPSLMLCNPNADNSIGTAWQASQHFVMNNGSGMPIYATPGYSECVYPPVADFSANLTTIITGESTTFTDLSANNPTSWSWTFVGGTPSSSNLQNPVVTYNTAGVYDVQLMVTNTAGNNTMLKSAYITVQAMSPPVAEFSANFTVVNAGSSITFTDLSTNNPSLWTWTFSGGSPSTSSIQNPVITYHTPGIFDVQLMATNDGGSNTLLKTAYITVTDPFAGNLMITEIMQNPLLVLDAAGEWFEVYNPTSSPVNMNGWKIKDDGTDLHTITTNLIVPAGGFTVLGVNSSSATNGGYTCNYQYATFFLGNTGDEVILLDPSNNEIDRVEYDGGPNWPDPNGASMVYTGTPSADNNNSSNWSTATLRENTYSGTTGDKGSPGTNGTGQNLVLPAFDLNLKVYLEGPFDGLEMNTYLTGLTDFPLTQPYNAAPWNYSVTESIASIPANVVDWVLVELRDATSTATATVATRISRKSALLLNNGSVTDLDGSSLLHFTNTVSNQLYVVVYHRNHLPVISSNAMMKVSGVYSYDFSSAEGQAYNGSLGHKQLAVDIWGMFAGNADGSSLIDISDKTFWMNEAAEKQEYYKSDFNLDTQVNNKDKDDLWVPNQGMSSQVP